MFLLVGWLACGDGKSDHIETESTMTVEIPPPPPPPPPDLKQSVSEVREKLDCIEELLLDEKNLSAKCVVYVQECSN